MNATVLPTNLIFYGNADYRVDDCFPDGYERMVQDIEKSDSIEEGESWWESMISKLPPLDDIVNKFKKKDNDDIQKGVSLSDHTVSDETRSVGELQTSEQNIWERLVKEIAEFTEHLIHLVYYVIDQLAPAQCDSC